jgi:hypothetical protein
MYMDYEETGKNQEPSWTQKHNKITLKNKTTKWKLASKLNWIIMFLMLLGISNLEENSQQNFYTPNNPFSNYPKTTSFTLNKYITFHEIGEMASQMMYINVNIPLNVTALYDQADLFTLYLQTL